ncbi:hypothetical protein PybrP1_000996 [[Pythium] brassicae (nom. inval.)]|nr:hypothetical protein PybrP1_000996 [[Pythium] brassicae (nom. inval.)]
MPPPPAKQQQQQQRKRETRAPPTAASVWRAKELRRRVDNRRLAAQTLVAGESHTVQLSSSVSLPQLWDAKQEALNLHLDVLSVRQKQDELDALQSRVLRLSRTLHDNADDKNFAKNKLAQLDEIRKQRSGLKQCAACKKEFLQHILADHEGNCVEAKKRFDDLSEDEQIQERRRQFHFRISELNSTLKDAEYNVQWGKDRRIDLVALIRAAEDRILEKQAELERAKMFRGSQMDSDVLENGLQRFYTKDLVFALEDEIGIEQLYIVDAKSEIIQVENYLRGDERKRDAILARLQNRRAALEKFELDPVADVIGSGTTDERKHIDERDAMYYPFLLEADARMDIEDHDGARALYDFVLDNAQWVESMTQAQIGYLLYKLGRAHLLLKNFERALALLYRASFLAARLGNRADEAGDKRGQIACFRGLQSAYTKLEDKEMVLFHRRQADDMEFALSNKLAIAGQVLETLQKRLVGVGAETSTKIVLERVGAIVPRLRTQRIQRKLDIGEEEKLVSSLEKLLAEKKALLAQGEVDLKRAMASETSQVDSSVISGTSARYEIEDFKKKLAKLIGSVQAGEAHIAKEIANAKVRIRNSDDEISDLEEELSVETGDLMRQIMERHKLRCFRFSATNEALKCVVGTASHGVPTCCASSELTGLLFDLLTGACLGQAVGDPHRLHLGPPAGHQARIVALYYVGNRIYTGGMDAALGVWEVQDGAAGGDFAVVLVKMMLEFDAAVVSVVADSQLIVCGCSDCDVFVFDAASLAVVARVIGAHERSIMAVTVDSARNWFTTGGADNRVKVWEIGASSSGTTRRKIVQRFCLEPERRGDEFFNGHVHPITCLKQVSSEIVSGDSNGRIVVWNLDAADERKLLRICDVHKRVPVLCLQFDATRIVSGAQDGGICSRIGLSATKKHHILGAGETLKTLSLKYHTSTEQLLKWNGLPDSSKLYLGQKLIVGVDASDSIAADELKTLDLAFSRTFGKVSSENLAFVAANKVKTTDVEAQWASRKLAMLAKEYFPPLDDENGAEKEQGDESGDDDASSDSGSDMPLGSASAGDGDVDERM